MTGNGEIQMEAERDCSQHGDTIDNEYVYEGKILNLRVDRVRFPSGGIKLREVVEHRPAVAILATDADGCVYLVSQYRHAVGETLYEIPAGLVENGENNAETASRELQEEAGLKPGSLKEIFTLYSSPGFSDEKIIFFWATDLTSSKLPQDDDECVVAEKFSLSDIRRMIDDGRISDAKTVAALCWYESQRLRDNARP